MHSSIARLPHRALSLICALLFNPAYDGPADIPPRQPDLAALATTCRCLSDLALDVLWRTRSTLVPLLLYTLPEDLCVALSLAKTGANRFYEHQVVFLRNPTAEDFKRFSIYASRVRAFSYKGTHLFDTYDVHPDVWTTLLRFGPKPLFPNIRTLEHRETEYRTLRERDYERGPFYPAEVLLGPRLQEIRIDYCGWPSDELRPTELVQAITRIAPSVEILCLLVAPRGGPLTGTLAEHRQPGVLRCPETRRLGELVEFRAMSVNVMPAALTGLASLPSLQRLTLRAQATAYDWDALPHGRRHGSSFFPALVELLLYETPCEWCVAFVRSVTSSSLRKLELGDSRSDSEGPVFEMPSIVFEALCAALATHPSRDTLAELRIVTTQLRPDRGDTAEVYQSRHIAPLLALPALEVLIVDGHFEVILDDTTLEAMSRAWPHIRVIRFVWPEGEGLERQTPADASFPKATLAGVLPLVRRCPRLTVLHIALDMRVVPNLDRWRRSPAHLAPAIVELGSRGCVYPAGADGEQTLATFLSAVCPRMRPFASVRGVRDPAHSSEARRLFKALVRVREEARNWALSHGRRPKHPDHWDGHRNVGNGAESRVA